MANKWDKETKEKAIRLFMDHKDDYASQWAAIVEISSRLGMSPETLRRWIRRHRIDSGQEPGVTSVELEQISELKRKNAELEQTIEILKAATSFFARESDPQRR